MRAQTRILLLYAEGLVNNILIIGEVNLRAVVSRAYYSAYLTAFDYMASATGYTDSKAYEEKYKLLKQTITAAIAEEIASAGDGAHPKTHYPSVDRAAEKIEKLFYGTHRMVSDYFIQIGEKEIGKKLSKLKRLRVKADYKLNAKVNLKMAKDCCREAGEIIEMINRLKNKSTKSK